MQGQTRKVSEVQTVLRVYAWQENLSQLCHLQSDVKGEEEAVCSPQIGLHAQTRPQDCPKAESVCDVSEAEESQ